MSAAGKDFCRPKPARKQQQQQQQQQQPPLRRPRKVAHGRNLARDARPREAAGMAKQQQQQPEAVPHIDLINFDCPEYDGLDYVLTSPRSLEACHRLGVQPVQLMYKHLQQFEEENPQLPVSRLFEMYDRHEQERKERLRLARLERERIVDEEAEGASPTKEESRTRPMPEPARWRGSAPALDSTDDTEWEEQVLRKLQLHEREMERLKEQLQTEKRRRAANGVRFDNPAPEADFNRQLQEPRRAVSAAAAACDGHDSWDSRQTRAASHRRQLQQQQEEANQQLLRQHQEAIARAAVLKQAKETGEQLRRQQRLRRKAQMYRERADSARREASSDVRQIRSQQSRREASADRNRELQQEKRQLSLKEQQLLQLQRYRSSLERRRQLESEIDEYKRELRRYRELADERAEQTVARNARQLALRASEKEAKRQATARRNLREKERLAEERRRQTDEQWQARLQEAVRQQEAKEKERESVRAVSVTAARLRQRQVRQADTFDRKVRQVNLVNQLGLGHEIK